jgi:hypothetical protein
VPERSRTNPTQFSRGGIVSDLAGRLSAAFAAGLRHAYGQMLPFYSRRLDRSRA